MKRTPMKSTAWNRAQKGKRNQPLPQEESAQAAIKTVAKFTRRGVIASVNDAVFAQPKEDVARCEKYRRLVALLPCCHYLIGTSGTYTREERRALDEQYGAQTRAKIINLGLWPATLPL